jgi:dTDP-4-amino-4,6-dideoxygalactose transaminase
MIPFVDLDIQYKEIKREIDDAIKECIADSNFIRGKAVADFEKSFASYLGINHCIGCGNGTDALEIILTALKIGPGDEVIVPALTWISTAEAVTNVGAEPVFVDVDPHSYTIDLSKIEKSLTNRTKAVIPVHLYGCPADMSELVSLAKRYGLHLIEDCAQAHGAEYSGKKVGTFGIASAFSFFPSKNLGAFGDAGAIVTDNEELSNLVRKISNHGQLNEKHKHFIIGRNSRLDSVQAAILNVKLNHLDVWNARRVKAADFYRKRLGATDSFILPAVQEDKKHVYHLFVIRCKERIKLIELLEEKKISWGIHYPNALPFIEPYLYKKHEPDDFKASYSIINEIISIPIYPEISEEQLELVCAQLKKYDR